MRARFCLLVFLIVGSACARSPAWESVPLATPIVLRQDVAPGELVVVVLDAHTNAALPTAHVILATRGEMVRGARLNFTV